MLLIEMPTIVELIADAKTLLSLEAEELADILFEVLRSIIGNPDGHFGLLAAARPLDQYNSSEWPASQRREVQCALAEAFSHLEHCGLIIRDPTQPHDTTYYVITRRGKKLTSRQHVVEYRVAAMLPEGLVHHEILERSRANFIRGDYDVSVLAAFKAVEVAVRKAGGYADGELGTALMRKAFHPETGPLTDKSIVLSEREAMGHLFTGAIGAAKNPSSHRNVEMSRIEAARLILFASYLMSIVDDRMVAFHR